MPLELLGARNGRLGSGVCLAEALSHDNFGAILTRLCTHDTLDGGPASAVGLVYRRVVQGEHVRRVLVRFLGVWWPLPLLALAAFLVEKGEVVRILTLLTIVTLAFFLYVFINRQTAFCLDGVPTVRSAHMPLLRVVFVLASGCRLELATTVLADALLYGETAVVCKSGRRIRRQHISTAMSAAALLRDAAVLLATKRSRCGSDAALRADVTAAALLHSVGRVHHDFVDIFSLGNL